MKINKETGLLSTARQVPSPNHDERPDAIEPSLIVIHNISLPPGKFGGKWVDALFTNVLPCDEDPFFAEIHELRVSSHLLVSRTGAITQYVPFHCRAWHAGVSQFQGQSVCNDFSIGIELEGTDDTAFTEAQYKALEKIIHVLINTYSGLDAEKITGHEHIAPGRKTDPGPFFDWKRLGKAFGVKLPADAQARCTSK